MEITEDRIKSKHVHHKNCNTPLSKVEGEAPVVSASELIQKMKQNKAKAAPSANTETPPPLHN